MAASAITLSRLLAYFIQVHKKHAPPIATTMPGLMLLNEISLPAIGGHCTSAAVLIGCHAQRNGPIESNGEI